MTSPSTDVFSDQSPRHTGEACPWRGTGGRRAHFGHGSRPAPRNHVRGLRPTGWRNGSGYLLFLVQDALVEVAHDHPGQPFVVDEEALADRVGVLLGDLERLLQDL